MPLQPDNIELIDFVDLLNVLDDVDDPREEAGGLACVWAPEKVSVRHGIFVTSTRIGMGNVDVSIGH